VIVRTTHYSLPEHLHKHIELVQPTTYFGRPKPMSTNSFILGILGINLTISTSSPTPPPSNTTPWSPTDPYLGTNCSDIITPSCLKGLYNATGYVPSQMAKNSIAVTGYLGQYANEGDLQTLYEILLPEAEDYTFETVEVNGARTQRWASCFYMGSGPDACYSCGCACQVGSMTRRYRMLDRRPIWTPNMPLRSLSRLRECFSRLEVAHPSPWMRKRKVTRTSLMTTCVAYLPLFFYLADVLMLTRSGFVFLVVKVYVGTSRWGCTADDFDELQR
jgi:hypothetical protein